MGYFVKNRRLRSGSSGVVIPTGSAAQRPDIANFGMIRYNTDSGLVEFFNGTVWDNLSPGGGINYAVDYFTGNGVQTVFGPMSVAVSSVTQIIVFVGSIYQNPTTAYTVDGSYDITFTSAPPNTVPINVIHTST
jgi:hypothetical protein